MNEETTQPKQATARRQERSVPCELSQDAGCHEADIAAGAELLVHPVLLDVGNWLQGLGRAKHAL